MVVKEAAASRLPCVGTRHGGLPEIVEEGETGYLVPERDIDALSERLGRLLKDAQLRERMGRAARAKMEREYDIRARNEELESCYDETIERFARTR
jgi:colanic acid/amylovoran biosynthesis glycosyltransferase